MRYHTRCRTCGASRKLRMHPEEYRSSHDACADRDLGGLIGIGNPVSINVQSAEAIACITSTAWALVRANLMLMVVIRSLLNE